MNTSIPLMMLALVLVLALVGCSSAENTCEANGAFTSESSAASTSKMAMTGVADASKSNDSSVRSFSGGWGLVSDDFIEQLVERYDELESYAIGELEDRKTAKPIHASLGDEVEATENLAVSVLSVEPGPYDHADNTPTVKVTVAMRNLTNKAISVKASNWDADNGNGQRVDHKLYIKDERGKRDVRSFIPVKVSPKATFTGVVYFDGESLNSIIYEPHWLVSSQNQYIYFDL